MHYRKKIVKRLKCSAECWFSDRLRWRRSSSALQAQPRVGRRLPVRRDLGPAGSSRPTSSTSSPGGPGHGRRPLHHRRPPHRGAGGCPRCSRASAHGQRTRAPLMGVAGLVPVHRDQSREPPSDPKHQFCPPPSSIAGLVSPNRTEHEKWLVPDDRSNHGLRNHWCQVLTVRDCGMVLVSKHKIFRDDRGTGSRVTKPWIGGD